MDEKTFNEKIEFISLKINEFDKNDYFYIATYYELELIEI
jgi:hypothetical protein